tara:strand:- start:2334 stop:2762 length:429 start_codon:yes stop_codon:yes gene_type:complete
MHLLSTVGNFMILLLLQVIIFRVIKFKKKWHLTTILIFLFILIIRNEHKYFSTDFFEHIIFNLVILTSYILFLTLIFNGSPSLYYLNNNNLDSFIKKSFIKNRTDLMIKDNLLNKKKKITSKGRMLLKVSKILSNIFFKENV